jgi:hypothetical protein
MKKLALITSYLSATLATIVGISTAIFAYTSNTTARATTVAVILGIFSIASWGISFTSPKNLEER